MMLPNDASNVHKTQLENKQLGLETLKAHCPQQAYYFVAGST